MKKLIVIAVLSLCSSYSVASENQEKGLQIAQEADRRDTGFINFTANIQMKLINRSGQESKRELRYKSLEVNEDGDKSLIIFDSPRDIKGVAALTYTHKIKTDDQWLYMPVLKRVKRIASENKSGPFMGSEFAYEDISSQEVEKYTYEFIKNDSLEGQDAFVVARYPVDKNSGYKRQLVWFDKQHYRILRIEYYDRKNELLKTQVNLDYDLYLEKYWRPGRVEMDNLQTGKKTSVFWSDYAFQRPISSADFNKVALKRMR